MKRFSTNWGKVADELKYYVKYLKNPVIREEVQLTNNHLAVIDELLLSMEKLIAVLEDINKATVRYSQECWIYCSNMACWMVREDCDERVGNPPQLPPGARHGSSVIRLSKVRCCLVKEFQRAKTYGFEDYGEACKERRCVIEKDGKLLVKDIAWDTYAELDLQNMKVHKIKYEGDALISEWKKKTHHSYSYSLSPYLADEVEFKHACRWRYVIENCRYKKTNQGTALAKSKPSGVTQVRMKLGNVTSSRDEGNGP